MESNEFLHEIYQIRKRLEEIRLFDRDLPFNGTEMQMIREIVLAKESGKRIISSKLAKILGVTRSAVSQMVNKMEARGVVCRVADATDRKIAYIELSKGALEVYGQMKERMNTFLAQIQKRLGEKKVAVFLSSANEFIDTCEAVLKNMADEPQIGQKD